MHCCMLQLLLIAATKPRVLNDETLNLAEKYGRKISCMHSALLVHAVY